MVDALDNIPFPKHDFVPQRHQLVLHVVSKSCHQMHPIGKERIEQLGRDVSSVGKKFPVNSLTQYCPDLRVSVIHVSSCKTEHYNLPSVVADKMQLEAVAPSHRALTVCGKAGKNLVGISAQVMANRYHGRVHKGNACAPAERMEVQKKHHLKEHPAFQFHKAVVGYRIWKGTPKMNPDEVEVVVFEVVKRAKVEHNKNGYNLAVGHAGRTPAADFPL